MGLRGNSKCFMDLLVLVTQEFLVVNGLVRRVSFRVSYIENPTRCTEWNGIK